MELAEIRRELDRVNREMQALFEERMALCGQVAEYKAARGMEIFVPAREAEILEGVKERARPGMADYDLAFFREILTLAKEYEEEKIGKPQNSPLQTGENRVK